MSSLVIHNIIKTTKNHTKSYEKLIKMGYSKDIIRFIYFVDYNINIDELIIENKECQKNQFWKWCNCMINKR